MHPEILLNPAGSALIYLKRSSEQRVILSTCVENVPKMCQMDAS